MMRRPNLNSLRMFDAAARHLNFRLAADELNLTQGAVAQQVRRLEADLGNQLFHRRPRGLTLTEAGRNYFKSVRRGLAIIDDATQALRPEYSSVMLSVTPSFASKWLVPRLAAFAHAHPDIEVQTIADEGLANFQSDGVDVAIRQGPPPVGQELQVELLAPLELCAVCGPRLAGKIGPIRQLRDFNAHRLIQDSHNLWDRMLAEAGIVPARAAIQFKQTALAMDAAANGQGIALAPRLLVDMDLASGRLVELWRDEPSEQRGYYLVSPTNRQSNPAVVAVIGWILSEAREC